ncbi:UvrB/UvrC motif-containing protein [candidate division KSB1 bacterium]|nr:UvrB/UvrC motif-containing protein [candidate division KSB1 bacterium]
MLCEVCHQKTATVKITQIINDTKKEINLCKACAEKQGLTAPLASFPELFGGLLENILKEGQSGHALETRSDAKCSKCGLTYQAFQQSGLLGCGHCYESFIKELKILLRRIHGSNKHIGDRPVHKRIYMHGPDVEKLRKELQVAIAQEQFEKAAELRDRIHDAERQMNL